MVAKAHSKNLEVLLETHTPDEFAGAMAMDLYLVGRITEIWERCTLT